MHTVSLPGVLPQEVLSRFLYFKYSRGTRCKKKKKKWGDGDAMGQTHFKDLHECN